ncbi:MAG: hypothetical protein LQ347_001080 [Umbilicaria vellea]|nr:MAG: hypothetical protein LQ347_001080 [Umbilicaria vellea]
MLQTRRCGARLLQRTCRRQQRRYDSDSTKPPGTSSGHQESAGHYEPTHHAHHPEPVNESLGVSFPIRTPPIYGNWAPAPCATVLTSPHQRGFYVVLGLIPLSFAIYKFSRSSDGSSADAAQPLLTRIMNSYSQYGERWAARNTLHTAMIEQAAHDRNLFHSSPPSKHIDLKFPEIFNTGSPYNVPAGQGGANLDALIAHYEKINADHDAAKRKEMEEGKKEPDPNEMVRRGTY